MSLEESLVWHSLTHILLSKHLTSRSPEGTDTPH